MLSRITLSLFTLELLGYGAIQASPVQAVPQTPAPTSQSSNVPPEAVMKQFYNYLNQYSLWLGDSRDACSYEVDPAGVKKDGSDRFFLAKISRGQAGTACRGVLNFQIMQVDCKTNTLYRFVREQKDDMRFAGWERYETTLNDPTNGFNNRSAEAVKAICTL